MRVPPENCPVCGEDVPRNARACPECGADELSGWREDADSEDALAGTEEDFDYDEFVRHEFGYSPRPPGIHRVWWITGLVMLAALLFVFLLR